MPIVADIRDQLLAMCGLESVSHGPANLTYRIISDINRAITAIEDANPNAYWQIRPNQAEVVRGPTTVSVTVTALAKTISFNSGYDVNWMPGCAILIDGDYRLNRLQNEATGTAPTLEAPYMGDTGTKTATVYQDWVRMPENLRTIMGPVTLDLQRPLGRATSLEQIDRRWLGPTVGPYGDYQNGYYGWPLCWQKAVGIPWLWHEVAANIQGTLRTGVLLDALPGQQQTLNYATRKSVFTPVTSLSDTRTAIAPEGQDQSILLPICRWMFADYDQCQIPKAELQQAYQAALELAADQTPMGARGKRFQYYRGR